MVMPCKQRKIHIEDLHLSSEEIRMTGSNTFSPFFHSSSHCSRRRVELLRHSLSCNFIDSSVNQCVYNERPEWKIEYRALSIHKLSWIEIEMNERKVFSFNQSHSPLNIYSIHMYLIHEWCIHHSLCSVFIFYIWFHL